MNTIMMTIINLTHTHDADIHVALHCGQLRFPFGLWVVLLWDALGSNPNPSYCLSAAGDIN